jgi:quercetin dioxygenase-like cupin family protein
MVLHNEGLIAALHFEVGGAIDEHDAPDDIIFLVISGSGWVRVGGPEALPVEVSVGDAVRWPSGVLHKAWTTDSPMTAIAVHYPMPEEK